MMKQNKSFKGDGGSCIDLLITNSFIPFLITNYKFIYDYKTIFESFEPKKLNIKQTDQLKLVIFNSMSSITTHAAFENNSVSILDKHTPKKTKNVRKE